MVGDVAGDYATAEVVDDVHGAVAHVRGEAVVLQDADRRARLDASMVPARDGGATR